MAGSHPARHRQRVPLNESPSEKEGKFDDFFFLDVAVPSPSMKVPPKRKGNPTPPAWTANQASALNESPSEKEGKCRYQAPYPPCRHALNESPSEKEGKFC